MWEQVSHDQLVRQRSKAKSAQTNKLTNDCRGLLWWDKVKMQIVHHFYFTELKGRHTIEKMRCRRKSAGSENVREKNELEEAGAWEIFRKRQCLLSVCPLSEACLTLKKDSIVRTSSEGFLSEAAEGQLVARPCWGAPQEDNLSRSLCWPLLPAHQNHQLWDRAACRLFRLLISHPDALTHIALSLISIWCFIPHRSFLSLSSSQCRIDVSSTPSYLSPPWVHLTMSQAGCTLPHHWTLGCFLCLQYFGKTEVTSLCFLYQPHEHLSAKKDGKKHQAKNNN